MDTKTTLLPERLVAAKFNVHVRTISRWDADPDLGFPPATVIRKRKYRDAAALDEWARANRTPTAADAA
jgi:hypothetical protein